MVQRKVYSDAEDRYGLVLVGTRLSQNDLGYPHVSVAETSGGILTKATFGTLEYIDHSIKQAAGPDVLNGDWMDAVVVAMDLLHKHTKTGKVRSKKIIVLSDMGCSASDDKLDMVVDAISRDQIELTFLLPQYFDDEMDESWQSDEKDDHGERSKFGEATNGASEVKQKTPTQDAGISLMTTLLENSPDGTSCGIEEAQELLFTKERKKKKSTAWKVDLEIGPDIRIPVAGYVAIKREAPKSWKRCLAKDDKSSRMDGFDELKPETTYVRNNEDQEEVEPDNLVDAFKYGSKVCPMSEVEKSAGKFESGPKSLLLIGFVTRAEVPVGLLVGEGCKVFKPLMDSQYSISALSSLVEAMVREEMVAIVRQVYSKNGPPKLAALIPENIVGEEGEEIRTLVYIELPFAEDLRNYQFPPLWSSSVDDKNIEPNKGDPSQEQLKAVDELIDSMMLSSDDTNERESTDINTENLMNPYYQHLYNCLTSRALNPAKGRSLPKVDARIKEILEGHEIIRKASTLPLSNISSLFKLETVVAKKEKQTGNTAFKNPDQVLLQPGICRDDKEGAIKRMKLDTNSIDLSLNDSLGSHVTEVGTTTPVEDFEKLLQAGFQISTLSLQMEKVILNLIKASYGNQFSEKLISCLVSYRQACIEMKSPTVYNKFIREIKNDLLYGVNKKEAIWKQIILRNIGLIDKNVCDVATDVTPEESKSFLSIENSEEKHQNDDVIPSDDEFGDLLDDL